MRRSVLAVLLLTACAPGCRAGTDAGPPGGFRLTYSLSGGIAAFDVVFVVSGDGRVRYQRNRPRPEAHEGRLGDAECRALLETVHGSGFLTLEERYHPQLPVSDAYTYSIRWEETGRAPMQVTSQDGALMPESFLLVREAVGALERKLLHAQGREGGGS